ncbi:MAG: threonine synthase [Legionella sp.]|nr:MAG: threonine synthase [Legionella sp.]
MSCQMLSTRGNDSASLDDAIKQGLAKDGGLYVPQTFPKLVIESFYDIEDLPRFAYQLLAPFFKESAVVLDQQFCERVFSFPLLLKNLSPNQFVLELFHGPTLSFKDFGARFFASCLQQLLQGKTTKVLVATSGDTGSAVASALSGKKGIEGIVLFPKDKISVRQQAQITCWENNIHAVAVEGTFDQCQQLVKKAFAEGLENTDVLTTANSINIARLLPQILFYAYASMQIKKSQGQAVNFIIPSGNLGNVTACYWANELGFPIDEILIATNKNAVLADFVNSGVYKPQPSIKTLANAMDVGDPSNLERLRYLYQAFPEFKKHVDVESIDDERIRASIKDCYERYGYLICPHTATAYARLSKVDLSKPWVIAATAHPAKFEEIIEPLLQISIPVPKSLQELLDRSQHFEVIAPNFESLRNII